MSQSKILKLRDCIQALELDEAEKSNILAFIKDSEKKLNEPDADKKVTTILLKILVNHPKIKKCKGNKALKLFCIDDIELMQSLRKSPRKGK